MDWTGEKLISLHVYVLYLISHMDLLLLHIHFPEKLIFSLLYLFGFGSTFSLALLILLS